MTNQILSLAGAWVSFWFILLLCRILFSQEKVGRIKIFFFPGVACLVALIVFGQIAYYINNHHVWFDSWYQAAPEFVQCFMMVVTMAVMTVGLFGAFGIICGHIVGLLTAVVRDDFEVWSACH